jgi:hypothetical protein
MDAHQIIESRAIWVLCRFDWDDDDIDERSRDLTLTDVDAVMLRVLLRAACQDARDDRLGRRAERVREKLELMIDQGLGHDRFEGRGPSTVPAEDPDAPPTIREELVAALEGLLDAYVVHDHSGPMSIRGNEGCREAVEAPEAAIARAKGADR